MPVSERKLRKVTTMYRKRRAFRVLKRSFVILILGFPFLLTGLWFVLHHRPSWYRPVTLAESQLQQVQNDATRVADLFGDRIVRREGFEFVLTDRQVNEWMAAWRVLFPDDTDWIPPGLSMPSVRFDDGVIRFGVMYDREGWRGIVGTVCKITIGENSSVAGRRVSRNSDLISISLEEVTGGSLPIPKAVVERLSEWLVPALQRSARDDSAHAVVREFSDIDSMDDLFRGIDVRNRFVWPNGERLFRITSIRSEDGNLTLGIEPL